MCQTSDIANALADGKLNARRFPGASGKMVAILGFILNREWTNPQIVTLSETSDGYLVTIDAFLGTVADLRDNLEKLCKVAGLTGAETRAFRSILVTRGLNQTASNWGG